METASSLFPRMFKISLGLAGLCVVASSLTWVSPLPEFIWGFGIAVLFVNQITVTLSFFGPGLMAARHRSWIGGAVSMGLIGWKLAAAAIATIGMIASLGLGIHRINKGIPDLQDGLPTLLHAPDQRVERIDWSTFQSLRGHQQRTFIGALFLFFMVHAGAFASLSLQSEELKARLDDGIS